MAGPVTTRLTTEVTAERDQLRGAATSALASADAGTRYSADVRDLLRMSAELTGILAELDAIA